MHSAGEMLWRFLFAFDKCFVDDRLGGHVREFEPLPSFHLPLHGFEVPLDAIDSNRNAIDHRERLRVCG